MRKARPTAMQVLDQVQKQARAAEFSAFSGQLSAMKAMAEAQGQTVNSLIDYKMSNTPQAIADGANVKVLEGSQFAPAANIEIVVTRTSAAGTSANLGDLPAIIGLPASRANDYQDIYSQFLTVQGLTLTVTRIANDLNLAYSNGVDTDNVRISCRDVAYNTFLEGLKFSSMSAWMARFAVPSTFTAQLSRAFNFFVQTPFGLSKKNTLVPGQFRDPKNNLDYIVDIKQPFRFGAVTGLVIPIAVGNLGGENSLNLSVEAYSSARI